MSEPRIFVNRHGVSVLLLPAPIHPGQWRVVPTPELESYLRSTARRDIDLPWVSMRTVDSLRRSLGISARNHPRRWYLRAEIATIILSQPEPRAARALGITRDEVEWGKRQLRRRGILSQNDVLAASRRAATRNRVK